MRFLGRLCVWRDGHQLERPVGPVLHNKNHLVWNTNTHTRTHTHTHTNTHTHTHTNTHTHIIALLFQDKYQSYYKFRWQSHDPDAEIVEELQIYRLLSMRAVAIMKLGQHHLKEILQQQRQLLSWSESPKVERPNKQQHLWPFAFLPLCSFNPAELHTGLMAKQNKSALESWPPSVRLLR